MENIKSKNSLEPELQICSICSVRILPGTGDICKITHTCKRITCNKRSDSVVSFSNRLALAVLLQCDAADRLALSHLLPGRKCVDGDTASLIQSILKKKFFSISRLRVKIFKN